MQRLLLALSLLACASWSRAEPVTVPGSGITVNAPPGMAWARTGVALVDEEAVTTLSFIVDQRRMSTLQDSAAWSPFFQHAPERVPGPGRLYRRTRADGDGWDGWLLLLPAGGGTLFVVVTYSGPSPEAFERLRGHVLSTAWHEAPLDPEVAFGLSLQPRGLKLVPGSLGVLAYTDAGEPGVEAFKEISLLVAAQSAMPPPQAAPIADSDCQQGYSGSAPGRGIVIGPRVDKGDYSYCESWHRDARPQMRYYALVRPAGGGPAVAVIGSAPGERFPAALAVFREAVAALRFTR